MLDVHTFAIPDGIDVPIALEELGLNYTPYPVNVCQHAQKTPEFLIGNASDKARCDTGRRFTWMVAPRSVKLTF